MELACGRRPQTIQQPFKTKVASRVQVSRTVLVALQSLVASLTLTGSILPPCLRVELVYGQPRQTIRRLSTGRVAWLIRPLFTASAVLPLVQLMPSILRRCLRVELVHGQSRQTIRRLSTGRVAWPIRALCTASAAKPLQHAIVPRTPSILPRLFPQAALEEHWTPSTSLRCWLHSSFRPCSLLA